MPGVAIPTALRMAFDRAAADGPSAALASPGVAGVCVLFNNESCWVDDRSIQEMFPAQGWEDTKSLAWPEFEGLLQVLDFFRNQAKSPERMERIR